MADVTGIHWVDSWLQHRGITLIKGKDQGTKCLFLVKEKQNVSSRLCQSQCMHVMGTPNAFVANRDKLYILPELADIVYDKVEKNELLEITTIYQMLKLPEVEGEIVLEKEATGKKSL